MCSYQQQSAYSRYMYQQSSVFCYLTRVVTTKLEIIDFTLRYCYLRHRQDYLTDCYVLKGKEELKRGAGSKDQMVCHSCV
jgi:hypothetical protein